MWIGYCTEAEIMNSGLLVLAKGVFRKARWNDEEENWGFDEFWTFSCSVFIELCLGIELKYKFCIFLWLKYQIKAVKEIKYANKSRFLM